MYIIGSIYSYIILDALAYICIIVFSQSSCFLHHVCVRVCACVCVCVCEHCRVLLDPWSLSDLNSVEFACPCLWVCYCYMCIKWGSDPGLYVTLSEKMGHPGKTTPAFFLAILMCLSYFCDKVSLSNCHLKYSFKTSLNVQYA